MTVERHERSTSQEQKTPSVHQTHIESKENYYKVSFEGRSMNATINKEISHQVTFSRKKTQNSRRQKRKTLHCQKTLPSITIRIMTSSASLSEKSVQQYTKTDFISNSHDRGLEHTTLKTTTHSNKLVHSKANHYKVSLRVGKINPTMNKNGIHLK